MPESFLAAIERHLHALVDGHPDRHIGRAGNIAAVSHVESELLAHGWTVESVVFDALDCVTGPTHLSVDGRAFPVEAGPYSTAGDVTGPLLPVDSLAALEAADLAGAVVLLHGAIAADQLFPKSFDFIDAPEHRRIYELLEGGEPLAVVGATGRGGGMGGGLYPYPLIEDGDFDIPNAFTTDTVGAELATLAGRDAHLSIESERIAVTGRQLTAARGPAGAPRAAVIAHIDSKGGSPGALDNATGVAALLGVGRLLEDYDGPYRVELIPMNGEDYYANPGEHLFVAANEGRWDELLGAVNMDAIGARGAGTAVSLYAVGERGSELIHRIVRRHAGVSIGEAWYESDHSIVAGQGRPTVAMTSTSFRELCQTVTHTEKDTLELVDPVVVAAAAEFVADLVRSLPAIGGASA
jgi:aminopeptidase YwaD